MGGSLPRTATGSPDHVNGGSAGSLCSDEQFCFFELHPVRPVVAPSFSDLPQTLASSLKVLATPVVWIGLGGAPSLYLPSLSLDGLARDIPGAPYIGQREPRSVGCCRRSRDGIGCGCYRARCLREEEASGTLAPPNRDQGGAGAMW